MQARHDLTGNFGNGRLLRIIRIFVSPPKRHKTLFQLKLLGLRESHLLFSGKLLGDGVGTDVDASAENLTILEKQDVAGFGTNVQDHRTTSKFTVIVTEGVA